jgi:hypothetical protein
MVGSISRLQQNAWSPFQNVSGESIPAFAVMRVTGTAVINGMPAITCAKPNATSYNFYVINGPHDVQNGAYGQCTYGPSVVVRYNTGTSPTLDAEWGAVNGSWLLGSGGTGFRVVGVIDSAKFSDGGILEAIQLKSQASEAAEYGFAQKAGQTINAGSSDVVLEWDTSGAYGNMTASTGSYKFVIGVDGLYKHLIRFDAYAATGTNASWTIFSSVDCKSVTNASSYQAGSIDIDGNTDDKPARCMACFTGWVLSEGDTVWAAVDAGDENVVVANMDQNLIYLGASS